jgi:two-component system repressor protein LuxO
LREFRANKVRNRTGASGAAMTEPLILIVEDSRSVAHGYASILKNAGYRCIFAETAADAHAALNQHAALIRAVLLDLHLPDMDGLDLLKDHATLTQRWPIIVATGDGSINRAIAAMRLGVVDFLVKPIAGPRLLTIVQNALQTHPTPVADAGQPPALPAIPIMPPVPLQPIPAASPRGFIGFVGMSPPMLNIYTQIENVARSRATIFITGESGTGKEVCAEAIHKCSPRGGKPFVAVNCGAIPEDLLESELFGHLKGSFTGAVSDRVGAVQAAQGGTLFLDEICEMELRLQVKLLRFLQSGTVQRVGSSRAEEVDVRIICATNRVPEEEVAGGRFREDLYYRLAVVPIEMPPLRARGHDIALLANHFLQRFAKEEGKGFAALSAEFVRALGARPWPGNVRELQNLMRRAAVMAAGPDLSIDLLPPPVRSINASHSHSLDLVNSTAPVALPNMSSLPGLPCVQMGEGAQVERQLADLLRGLTLDDVERIAIDAAIDQAGGSLPGAAKLLGVSPSTLYRKRERWLDCRSTG